MREFLVSRLQYLYHCRICNRVSVHRLQFSTALQVKQSSQLLLRYGIQTLKHGERLTTTSTTASRGCHSLSHHLERFRLNTARGKFFKGRTLFHSGLRQLVSQHLFRSPKAAKITLASGGLLCGGLGGFLFVNRDQTTGHQSETECDCGPQKQNCDSSELKLAQTPISELSLIQQLKLIARFLYLSVLFSPAIILYGVSFLTGSRDVEHLAWRYVYFAIQLAGPAFIKLGQWASTRRDMFSEDFCGTLSKLHTRCSPHSWRATERLLCENFGENWVEKVIILDHSAIGSGCVAQVYQGYLRTENGDKKLGDNVLDKLVTGEVELKEAALTADHGYIPIAVKVLHPGIVEAMDGDIRLMKYVASWVDYVYPDVHWIALKECVEEFATVMQQQVCMCVLILQGLSKELIVCGDLVTSSVQFGLVASSMFTLHVICVILQLDLKLEAKNLLKFQDLMNGYENIKFPTPILPYVTNSVLVESFEVSIFLSCVNFFIMFALSVPSSSLGHRSRNISTIQVGNCRKNWQE